MWLAEAHDEARTTLVEVARPIIARLRESVDETVLIARCRGDFALRVDRVESTRPVSLQFDREQPMALLSPTKRCGRCARPVSAGPVGRPFRVSGNHRADPPRGQVDCRSRYRGAGVQID